MEAVIGVRLLHRYGLAVNGRASKVISDSLRRELARGRVVRVARGVYTLDDNSPPLLERNSVYTMASHSRDELATITAGFLSAFNENDLDQMMSFFAADGVYEEFNGAMNRGLDEVRAAFAPQFAGAFGEMKFLDEDLIVDAEAGKVMASWTCTLEVKGAPTAWRGLDAITYNADGKVTHKLTYAKTKAPLFS